MSVWSDIERIETNAIPDDVMKYAEAVERVWRELPPREAVLHHARAIMAERERCLVIAGEHALAHQVAAEIAAAIRKGEA